MSNADLIQQWRDTHPGRRITYRVLRDLLGVSSLRGADLRKADLRKADLWGADLRKADLWGADLRKADLLGADLREADLRGADLRKADLWGANLWEAGLWGGLPIQAGESGSGYLVPTPGGWRLTIGCWRDHPLSDLMDLIEDRAGWPEAEGEERERRRPMLRAVYALCEAHITQHPGLIDALADGWNRTPLTDSKGTAQG